MVNDAATAVQRCPSEIWIMIFRFTLFIPPLLIHGVETDSADGLLRLPVIKREVVSVSRAQRKRRSAGQIIAGRLSRVCRAWYDMIVPIEGEWMRLTDFNRERCWSTLILPFGDGRRGSLIRSLHLIMRDRYRVNLDMFLSIVRERLEEVDYQDQSENGEHSVEIVSELREILLAKCSKTLKHLIVEAKGLIRMHDVAAFLALAPRLERLSFSAMYLDQIDEDPMKGLPLPEGPLALRSFSWTVGVSTPAFFDLLSHFRLPRLVYVSLFHYQPKSSGSDFSDVSDDDEDETERNAPILPYLDMALQIHGPKLKCLDLYEVSSPSGPSLDTVLRTCPNLLTLGLSLLDTVLPSQGLFHAKLRPVICHETSFFTPMMDHTTRFRQDMLRVRKTIAALCGEGFPALRTLVVMDIQRPTPNSRDWGDQYGHPPMREFKQLLLDTQEMCKVKKVLLKDCTGKLIDPEAFSPTWQWFYRTVDDIEFDSDLEGEFYW